jgi:TPR repeat protein
MKLKALLLVILISFSWVNVVFADAGFDAYKKKDYSEAYRIWKPRAESGEAYAQDSIGYLYFYGNGVLKDEKKGLEWYEKAAFNGLAEAQRRMAIHYLNERRSVDKHNMGWDLGNLGKARFWIEKLNNNQNSSKYKDEIEKWWNEFEIWKYSVPEYLKKREEKSRTFFDKVKSFF